SVFSRICPAFLVMCDPRNLHPFPTRRSSDLYGAPADLARLAGLVADGVPAEQAVQEHLGAALIHELSHAGRARDALCPPYLDERSEEHTSELQSRGHLVCRRLLEKKTMICS